MQKPVFVALTALLALSACDKDNNSAQEEKVINDFSRVNSDGTPYTGNNDYATTPWACVFDKRTGLLWEVKTKTPDLHNAENVYTWYNPDVAKNNKQPGIMDGGKCIDSKCDTLAYVEAVNEKGLCGYKNWRMPNHVELGTIINRKYSKTGATVDPAFFPNTPAKDYWTADSYSFHYVGAWSWDFSVGYDHVDWKKSPKHVRLVRSDDIDASTK